MKTVLSLLLVVLAGLVGLALVFTDVIPISLGPARVAFGAGFYILAGFLLGRWNAKGRPLAWAASAAWGLVLLGAVGLWTSVNDPPSGDYGLALLFLLGPLASALGGGWLGRGAARK